MFLYKMPTELIMGKGCSEKIGSKMQELNIQKVFLVIDKGVYKAGVIEGIFYSLQKAGIEFDIYSEIDGEPSTQMIESVTVLVKKNQCDAVIVRLKL